MSYSIKKKHKIIHFTDSSEINIDLKTTDVCSISSYENAEGIMSLPRYIEEKSDHFMTFLKKARGGLFETTTPGNKIIKKDTSGIYTTRVACAISKGKFSRKNNVEKGWVVRG